MTDYYETQDTIKYVNARKGNRPPSIKTATGTYFTVSDAGYQMVSQYQGQLANIAYFVNGRGYHVATAINGMEIPEDPRGQRGGGPPQGRPMQQNRPAGAQGPVGHQGPQQLQQRPAGTGVVKAARMEAYSRIAAACIETGLTTDDFRVWVSVVGEALGGQPKAAPPPPPQPEPPPPTQADEPHGQGHPAQKDFSQGLDDDIPF